MELHFTYIALRSVQFLQSLRLSYYCISCIPSTKHLGSNHPFTEKLYCNKKRPRLTFKNIPCLKFEWSLFIERWPGLKYDMISPELGEIVYLMFQNYRQTTFQKSQNNNNNNDTGHCKYRRKEEIYVIH